ncbi:MAG: hypothetical protein HY303_06795 [Candidatus Wallbacteria bacterium]|nr:hypothetical protein [Candidatus Wallbacteria bacterium]
MRPNRSLFLGSMLAAALGLAGCGAGDTVVIQTQPAADGDNTATAQASQGTIIIVRRVRRRPPAPGAGTADPGNTPTVGGNGPGAPVTPPPNVTPGTPPTGGAQFDANAQAVIDKYNLVITGADASGESLNNVLRAAQLYQPRQHKLLVRIQRDPAKLPIAGVWWSTGNGATTELYQPQMAHVPDHEIAHDLTLKVNPGAGNRLGNDIVANQNDPSVFPSSYAHSAVPEAMAEALSTWAEKVGFPGGGSAFYNPPAAIVADLQPFLADGLRNK